MDCGAEENRAAGWIARACGLREVSRSLEASSGKGEVAPLIPAKKPAWIEVPVWANVEVLARRDSRHHQRRAFYNGDVFFVMDALGKRRRCVACQYWYTAL